MNKENEEQQISIQQQMEALLPAYAIGATDPEETAFVERFLGDYPQLAAELADYAELSEQLLYASPPLSPPPALEGRLRAALAEEDAPSAQPASRPGKRAGFWDQVRALFDPNAWTPLGVAAAAAILLLVVLNGVWLAQINRLEAEQVALQAQLDRQDRVLAMLSGAVNGAIQEVDLRAAGDAPDAYAELRWDPGTQVAVLKANDFPPLPQDKVYQLWLIQDDERTSGGLFTTDEMGSGVLVFTPPAPLDSFDAFGITPEPAGGSEGPTAPPVALGKM